MGTSGGVPRHHGASRAESQLLRAGVLQDIKERREEGEGEERDRDREHESELTDCFVLCPEDLPVGTDRSFLMGSC